MFQYHPKCRLEATFFRSIFPENADFWCWIGNFLLFKLYVNGEWEVSYFTAKSWQSGVVNLTLQRFSNLTRFKKITVK